MPEYQYPGVFVEEVSFRTKSIEGVSTDAAAFVGPTLRGPASKAPQLLESYADYTRIYGSTADFRFGTDPLLNRNYMAHAARAFFDNGGKRLYVARTPQNSLGTPPSLQAYKKALGLLATLDDISTVAAPGYSVRDIGKFIQQALIDFSSRSGIFRLAVLDVPPHADIAKIQEWLKDIDSSSAALFYPWIRVTNPLASDANSLPKTISLPPSGFICGIYARNDIERGVYKAPANETIIGALDFEQEIDDAHQEFLNSLRINCLRHFDGRGNRVWAARTLSSSPEWKYVNVRRYFSYLEKSISRGTEWASFEPNQEPLWSNLLSTIGDFLFKEWCKGGLLGGQPKDAYFVRCDRSTMTQNDLDNGRCVCLIGAAPLKPAEFIIFRVSHLTADAAS